MEPIQSQPWHTLSSEQAFQQLESKPGGLSQAQAAARLLQYGPNELQAAHRISPWEILLEQFKNVLILILLGATVISLFLGHGIEAVAIAVIVLFAVLLGFVQEYRAEKAIEALRRWPRPRLPCCATAKRWSWRLATLYPATSPFYTGDKIPADVRLLEAINLQVEEAALTGESVPVEKQVAAIATADLALGDRRNMGYAGTVATYGRGRAVVIATGMNTEFGKIAGMLQAIETGRTPLQENLDRVGGVLARVAFVIVGIIVALGLFRGQDFIEMLIFGVALAVAVVPEALPAVVTISLAIGVQRMVKRNALMRRLPAVETLGSTSVICSDKTGTLTKDEMTVRRVHVAGQMFEVSGAGYEPHGHFSHNGGADQPPDALRQLLRGAALASDAHIVHNESENRWHVKGDPTEGALVVAAAKAGMGKAELDRTYPRLDEIPFSPRKRSA
jgi:Ca2+-transporting ATPase